jgi:hypothetical protein
MRVTQAPAEAAVKVERAMVQLARAESPIPAASTAPALCKFLTHSYPEALPDPAPARAALVRAALAVQPAAEARAEALQAALKLRQELVPLEQVHRSA